MIKKKYIPDYIFHSVLDISPEGLLSRGITLVAVDADNTLVYDNTIDFIDGAKDWVNKIRQGGLEIAVISNASLGRAEKISNHLGIKTYGLSFKPSPKGILKAAEDFNIPPEKIAMIGDQITTDVVAANKAGAVSIKTDKIENEIRFYYYYALRRKREASLMKEVLKLKGYGFND
ncbi:MAG: YqeG family HAD IIIA-type phosphatase [Ruminococcaceae bacterium]|nr:YqeG family HAD IIIA-type phosphatase [Oscillospiraceae bacterium]